MKKAILLSACMLCFAAFSNAQFTLLVDDAVQGTALQKHNYVGGGWVHGSFSYTFYQGTLSYSNVAGAYVTIGFDGTGIAWYTEKKNTHGIAAVSIDGGAESLVDLFAVNEDQNVLVYKSPVLPLGTHTFKIRVTGTKNTASTGYYVIHDYSAIFGTNQPTQPDGTNTSLGNGSLSPPVFGGANSAFGSNALHHNALAGGNTAIGAEAMFYAAGTANSTGVGYNALRSAEGGWGNTAVGAYASAFNGIDNPGLANTAIGYGSGPLSGNLTNTTALGFQASVSSSNQVRIGNESVTSIGGQVSWSTLSDGRFKRDLKEDVSGLEFVKGLRPVSYTVDKKAIRQFIGAKDIPNDARVETKEIPRRQTGFVAQEVDALVKKSGYIFNGVDVPQNEKDPYTIRYAEFVVPLVKAVQELSAKVEEQEKQIDQLLQKIGERESGTDLNSNEISLFQNAPNPFSMNTEIKMALPESVISANVIVYNLEGKQLKEMKVNQRGDATVTIQGNELTAGMYIYALIADGKVIDTKRMILTK